MAKLWIYYFCRFIGFLLFKIFFRLRVQGAERIPAAGAFLVASNHVSFLDPVAVGVASPRVLNYMAKESLFKNPLFGWFLRSLCVFPLKRKGADVGALKEALKRLREGSGLLLFPEGTRSADGRLREGLAGVGFLARKSGAPVVPAFVIGAEKALPKRARFFRPCRVRVVFGEPLVLPQGPAVTDEERTESVMRGIEALGRIA